ncbi:MAG: pyruvate dehydrogenase complex E1 component subunit beta [Phycisphaerales bacterium]|nr:pyruvate dehydrogenase complex E1 component subunit beta [Phycisphaerales bacterium]
MPILQFREALRQAMCEEMDRDSDVFLMGEEVAQYDGAYKVSQGMLARYGPMRVVDTPISECGFAGLGIGAAMAGMRPIVEFMTFSFSLVAFDQVANNAPKMLYMSGGQFKVPIVFRGISGPGQQLAATHSWSVDALYTHIPGLKVAVPTTPAEAKGLLKTAIRDDDPVIFLENESMYANKGEVPDGEFLLPFGQADIKRPGTDCTLVAWGQGCLTALAAAELLEREHGIHAEVVDPRTLRPLDLPTIVKSVKKTGYCVTVETGYPTCGVGAELAALIHEHCFDDLDNHVVRVASLDVPMPYSKPLLQQVVPNVRRVVDAVKKATYFWSRRDKIVRRC